MVWLKFFACVVIILIAGSKAARYADIIADKSKLGRIFIGMLVLAMVTSMPELVTSVSSVVIIGDTNLGFSTLLGTVIFNLCILAFLDVFYRPKPLLSEVNRRHIRLARAAVFLSIVIGIGILLEPRIPYSSIGWVGLSSFFLFIFYLLLAWRIAQSERLQGTVAPVETVQDINLATPLEAVEPAELQEIENVKADEIHFSWRSLWVKFGLSAMAIIIAGIWLSYIGEEIAIVTGWGASFVGSLLLAVTTSLPEITVAVAAVRLGALDLAVADILGANMLDLAYIFILDVASVKGPILSSTSLDSVVLVSLYIMMNLIVMLGLRFQQEKKTFVVFSWYSVLLIVLYIVGAVVLFFTSSN